MQFTWDVGDRRLPEFDLPEQALRYLDNQLMSVLFLGFSLRPHILTVQISGTIVMARALGFAQIAMYLVPIFLILPHAYSRSTGAAGSDYTKINTSAKQRSR